MDVKIHIKISSLRVPSIAVFYDGNIILHSLLYEVFRYHRDKSIVPPLDWRYDVSSLYADITAKRHVDVFDDSVKYYFDILRILPPPKLTEDSGFVLQPSDYEALKVVKFGSHVICSDLLNYGPLTSYEGIL